MSGCMEKILINFLTNVMDWPRQHNQVHEYVMESEYQAGICFCH